MRRLVTGGAGFIGSNYVRHVLDTTDDEVVVLDALTYAGHRSTIADLVDGDEVRCRLVVGDVRDRQAVAFASQGCEVVVHLAAESHVDLSIASSDEFVSTNCVGTNVVCDVARQLGVRRVVHVSTDEVYGSRADGSFTEQSPLRPSSPYSASKAGSDLIALAHHVTHGLDVVVTRSSNNYGPHQLPEKVIPLFVTNLLDGRHVPLYGDGRNVRDWIHVSDNVAGIETVLERAEAGEVVNLGGGHELTNGQLTDALLELCGRDGSYVDHVADRLGHDLRYSIDTTRARALGWAPRTDPSAGLADTVDWYRANRSWWEPLAARVRARR